MFGSLVLAERLLVPAAAWSFFGVDLGHKIALTVAVGLVLATRTFLQHDFRARTEVETFERIAARLMQADVLRVTTLPDDEARAELGQASYHVASSITVTAPRLLADAIATAPLMLLVVIGQPPRVVALAMTLSAAAVLLLFLSRQSVERALGIAWAAQQEAYTGFIDALEGRLEVVASGRRSAFLEMFRRRTLAWAVATSRVAYGALFSGKLPLLAIATAVAMFVAVMRNGGRVLGITTADVAFLASVAPAFAGVAQGVFVLARDDRWMEVVANALAEPIAPNAGTLSPPLNPAPIAFDRVSFRYEDAERDALHELTFIWDQERILAITGANGSGKSTCLRLLLGLGRPSAGSISLAGVALDKLNVDDWRARVAFLPQRPYLPPRSNVRAAVRFVVPDATDEMMRCALVRVGLLGSLERASADPLATRVDTLSIGQRQRLGLARLLCQRRASLVLFDEPDANLDRDGIALVAELMQDLAREKMVAVVAHGPELVDIADRIIVLEEGSVLSDRMGCRRLRRAVAK